MSDINTDNRGDTCPVPNANSGDSKAASIRPPSPTYISILDKIESKLERPTSPANLNQKISEGKTERPISPPLSIRSPMYEEGKIVRPNSPANSILSQNYDGPNPETNFYTALSNAEPTSDAANKSYKLTIPTSNFKRATSPRAPIGSRGNSPSGTDSKKRYPSPNPNLSAPDYGNLLKSPTPGQTHSVPNSPMGRDWNNDAASPNSFNYSQNGTSPTNVKSVNELEKQLTSLQNQNFNLKLKIYFLEEQKTIPNEGERELSKSIVNLKVQEANLIKENKEKTDAIAQASRAINYLESQQKALETSLTQCQEKIKRLEEDLEKKDRLLAHREVEQLRQLEVQDNDYYDEGMLKLVSDADTTHRLEEFVKTKHEQEKLIETLTAENTKLEMEMDKWQICKKELTDQNENLSTKCMDERKKNADLLAENEELKGKVKEHEVGLKSAAKVIDKLALEIKALKLEVKRSNSVSTSNLSSEKERTDTTRIQTSIQSSLSNALVPYGEHHDMEVAYLREEIKKIIEEKNSEIVDLKLRLAKSSSSKEILDKELTRRASDVQRLSNVLSKDILSLPSSERRSTPCSTSPCATSETSAESNARLERCESIIKELEHKLEEKEEHFEEKRGQLNDVISLLKLRLEELAGFLNTLLERRDVLNHFCDERLDAMKKAVDKSMNISCSVDLDGSYYNLSKYLSKSIDPVSEVIDLTEEVRDAFSQNVVETLRNEVIELRDELDKSYKKKETSRERRTISAPKMHSTLKSDSEDWSEPDRNVSQQRIGLEVVPYQKASEKDRSLTRSSTEEDDNSFGLKNKSIIEKVNNLEKEIIKRDNNLLEVKLALVQVETAFKEERMSSNEARKELERMTSLADTLSAENVSLKQKLRDCKVELEMTQEQSEYLTEKHEKALEFCLQKQRDEFCEKIDELKAAHDKDIKEYNLETEKCENEIHALESKLDTRISELNQCKKRLEDALDSIGEHEERQAELRAQLLDKEEKVKSLKRTIDENTIQASKTAVERSKAVNEKAVVLNELQDLAAKYDTLLDERYKLKEKLLDLENFNSQICNKLNRGENGNVYSRPRKEYDTTSGYGSEENPTGGRCSPEQVINRLHDCEKMELENEELKRRLAHTKRTLEHTFNKLKMSNQLKEKVERDIQKQLVKTNNVLKIARNNIENYPK